MEHTPSAAAESQIKIAAEMIREGHDPEKISRFIYLTGYTDGALDMAKVGLEKVKAAMRAAA